MTEAGGAQRAGVALVALSVCAFLAVTTELLPIGLIPSIAVGLHVTTPIAGLSISVFAVLVGVLAVPMTVLTARLPRKTLLVISLGGYAVSNIVCSIAPDFTVLCVGRAIGGLSHAVFYSVVTAYASALVPAPRIGRALSIAFAGASLGAVLGVPLTTFIGAQAGWRCAFVVMAVIAAVLAVLVAIIVPGVRAEEARTDGSRYRPGRGLVAVVIADVLVFLGHHTAYTYVAPLLALSGVDAAGLSGALLLIGVVSLGGLAVSGTFADRHLGAAFVGCAAVIAITLAVLFVVGRSPVASVAVVAIWSLAYNAVSPLVTTAVVRTGAVSASLSGAVVNGASNIGITLGSLLGGGVIAAGSLSAVPIVGAGIAAVAAVVAFSSRRGFPRVSLRRAP